MRLNLALPYFLSLSLVSLLFYSQATDVRLRLVLLCLAFNNAVLALGGAIGSRGDVLGYPLFALLAIP